MYFAPISQATKYNYLDDKFQLVPDAPEDLLKKNAIIDAYIETEYQKNEKMNR